MHAPGDRREGACTRAETNGKSVRAQGVLASSLALPLGTSPLPAPRPAKATGTERGAQGQGWRRRPAGPRPALARFLHLFKGKRQGSAPSPSVFARVISSEATTVIWHRASAALSAPGRGEGPTAPAVKLLLRVLISAHQQMRPSHVTPI